MSNYFATGYNDNSQLGLGFSGDVTSFTEQQLPEGYQIVKICNEHFYSGSPTIFLLYNKNTDKNVLGVAGPLGDAVFSTINIYEDLFSSSIVDASYGAYVNLNKLFVIADDAVYFVTLGATVAESTKEMREGAIPNKRHISTDNYTESGESLFALISTDERIYYTTDWQSYTEFEIAGAVELSARTVYQSLFPTKYFMALTGDGNLYGWGNNSKYTVGPDNTTNPTSPQLILSNVKQFSTHSAAVVAVTNDGKLYAWGKVPNYYNMTDTHLNTESYFDVSNAVMEDVSKAFWVGAIPQSSGDKYTRRTLFVLKNDGSIFVNGRGEEGQTGTLTGTIDPGFKQVPVGTVGDCDIYNQSSNAFIIPRPSTTITVYDNTGSSVLLTAGGLTTIERVKIAGNASPYMVEFIDAAGKSTLFSLNIKGNRKFLGLSLYEGASTPEIPKGETEITLTGEVSLFVVLGAYDPKTGFHINCYKSIADPRVVDKMKEEDGKYLYVSPYADLVGTLRNECDIMAPTIIIEYPVMPEWNYVYIELFNRYYFVGGFVSLHNNVWAMSLVCDVLTTYKNDIYKMSDYIIGRQASEEYQNASLEDDMEVFEDGAEFEIISDFEGNTANFGNVTERSFCYLLTTWGTGGSYISPPNAT